MDTVTKQEKLYILQKELETNTSLPLFDSANLVFGEGNPDTMILFIGEAPGFHEDIAGRPFVGRAGKLLDELLAEIDLPRESAYITNIVKRRPQQNRDPKLEEIDAYKPYLQKQIDIIRPVLIATLGRFSMNYFLPDAKISKTHGKLMRAYPYIVYPLYHPAAALRSTAIKEELKKDFLRLPNAIEHIKKMS